MTFYVLVTFYVLFFIDPASRTVKIAGVTTNPGDAWMSQIARNLTDLDDGFLGGTRYLILDRDTKYSDAFRKPGAMLLLSPRQCASADDCSKSHHDRDSRAVPNRYEQTAVILAHERICGRAQSAREHPSRSAG